MTQNRYGIILLCVIASGIAIVYAAGSTITADSSPHERLRSAEYIFVYELCNASFGAESSNLKDVSASQRARDMLESGMFSDDSIVVGIESYYRVTSQSPGQLDDGEKLDRNKLFMLIVSQRLSRVQKDINNLPPSDSLDVGLPGKESNLYTEELNNSIRQNNAIGFQVAQHGEYGRIKSRLMTLLKDIQSN